MSGQPISLSDLRERNPFIDDTPDDVLLALVEAVDAAKALRDIEAHMPVDVPGAKEWSALDDALARFTDHKGTRLCDCGRADVMDEELSRQVAQLRADLDAAENTSRLHERSWHRAEAEAAQLQAELEHARLDATMGHTRATQLRAERDRLREALETWPQDDSVHEPGCRWIDLSDDCDCFTSIARAALAPAPEAETT